ncbi:MAG: hypothetical protein QOI11_3628 [Candidatus Eremiobacteraeota bacterium]|jgi:hypothetical protein|nr:hypothetical protein [Candidatus Eremiobacteraeota bacterium]
MIQTILALAAALAFLLTAGSTAPSYHGVGIVVTPADVTPPGPVL